MNAGYVRLSRDDDKRNYVSIENQKLIINQYAASINMVIDQWYEDDGVSGYKFDRPGFNQLMDDLDKDIDVVFVKDFSRLGRHNAKVLLLIDEFQEREKRLIVIDDNYDSLDPDDDVIGIKTWYNERYVKDASKKIKSALNARQKEGTLMTHVPFGYRRDNKNRKKIEIVPNEAEYIKMVFELYIQGSGYRKIANYLSEHNIPTPSMIRRECELLEGKNTKRHVADEWSDGMVKDMLGNDFYIGTLRLHKRARVTIHGKDKKVPRDEQYIFENNHPAIIDKMTFELVQEIKEKRLKSNYRGSHGQWIGTEIPNPFGSCLFCKDCGSRLSPILRKTGKGERKYYICSRYNTKGRQHCPKAHLIVESNLMEDVIRYIQLCRNSLCEMISAYDMKDFESEKKSLDDKRMDLQNSIAEQKNQLKALLSQRIRDISNHPDNEDIINESYEALQSDILSRIHGLELKFRGLNETSLETPEVKKKLKTALEVVDEIIQKGTLHRPDIEILIERIEVDENGLPDIQLKYGLSGFIKYNPALEANRIENTIILTAMKLIRADNRGYTSAKYLSAKLTEAGFSKSKKAVLPYIGLLIDEGILEPTDNPLKPYTVLVTQEELNTLIVKFQKDISSVNPIDTVCDSTLHKYEGDRRNA
ncbi:DNA invertase Pin-like site-specific DNA recombinase [Kineothrix alysoides]|uniref:DNA invertase Pin-like site-specific DNA recombinase n=1 Tax=Kineothrix alysoides TaxID=1469948 RepID=A0A4R1R0U9_9FIRM|nr:recombinase family protein [Kineothrix alysoides]TCL58898.1 DNA invertase Pin-like site-specific DNA recombinase [Kineothrix alysoides]